MSFLSYTSFSLCWVSCWSRSLIASTIFKSLSFFIANLSASSCSSRWRVYTSDISASVSRYCSWVSFYLWFNSCFSGCRLGLPDLEVFLCFSFLISLACWFRIAAICASEAFAKFSYCRRRTRSSLISLAWVNCLFRSTFWDVISFNA